MDWLKLRPEQLAGRTEPKDVLAELRKTQRLPPEARTLLDFALRHWIMKRLARPSDTEGVLELDDLAAIALHSLPDDEQSAPYRARWQAFRDLLESKRLAIGGRESGRARNLLHASPILELLQHGPVPQAEVRKRLGLSAARLSQVLGVMEEGGLIARMKRGKENVLSVPGWTGAERSDPDPGTASLGHAWKLAA